MLDHNIAADLLLGCKTRHVMTITSKTTLIAAGLAFLVNNGCVLLLMATGMIYQWFLVLPLIDFAINLAGPTFLNLGLLYLFGFLQYFVIFWIIIRLIYGRRAA